MLDGLGGLPCVLGLGFCWFCDSGVSGSLLGCIMSGEVAWYTFRGLGVGWWVLCGGGFVGFGPLGWICFGVGFGWVVAVGLVSRLDLFCMILVDLICWLGCITPGGFAWV